MGVRTLKRGVDTLSLAYITRERPSDESKSKLTLAVQKVVVSAKDLGIYPIGYNGLHCYGLAFINEELLDQLYITNRNFQSLDSLHNLTIKDIDIFLERKITLFDYKDKGILEYMACANGYTCNLILEKNS